MKDTLFPLPGAALVTGASRGIGKVVAIRLGAVGIPVAVNFRQGKAEADAVVDEIASKGGRAIAVGADVADPEAAATLVAQVEEALGPVSVVINNAGITRDRLLVQMSEDDWAATWRTDLVGPRIIARAAAVSMCARRQGRIVNVGSVVGVTGNGGQANYATAKSALQGLTRELAIECGPHNVSVNCVVPGYIETDATAHLNGEQRLGWLKRIPMRRFASPDEVADIIVFLAGSGASYVTGQCIAVDGGFLAKSGAFLAS